MDKWLPAQTTDGILQSELVEQDFTLSQPPLANWVSHA